MIFLKANIDIILKHTQKNNKPVNIVQFLILNLSIKSNLIYFYLKKNILNLQFYHNGNCRTINTNIA